MLRLEEKKQTMFSSKLVAISAALVVLIVSLGVNEFASGENALARVVASLPATEWFPTTEAQNEKSTISLGSTGLRGPSVSLMIFRLN